MGGLARKEIMSVTEEINQWITEYGSERDALNVALAKLRQAQAAAVAPERPTLYGLTWMLAPDGSVDLILPGGVVVAAGLPPVAANLIVAVVAAAYSILEDR